MKRLRAFWRYLWMPALWIGYDSEEMKAGRPASWVRRIQAFWQLSR